MSGAMKFHRLTSRIRAGDDHATRAVTEGQTALIVSAYRLPASQSHRVVRLIVGNGECEGRAVMEPGEAEALAAELVKAAAAARAAQTGSSA